MEKTGLQLNYNQVDKAFEISAWKDKSRNE